MPIDVASHIVITHVLNTYSAPSSAAEKTALFADDSTLIVHGGAEYSGKSTIETFFAGSEKTKKPGHPFRHHLSSIKIDADGSDHASSVSYFLVMGNTAPDHWGVIEGADPKGWIGSGAGPVKL